MNELEFLASVPMFSQLSRAELEKMSTLWIPINKSASEVIFKKGDTGNAIYLIKEGTVSISLHAINGDELVLSELHKGDVFGELTLFDNVPRTATATSFDDTELLYMPRDTFINFIRAHPEIAIIMLGILGQRLRNTNEIIQQQATRNVNEVLEDKLSIGERFADKVAEFVGSWSFIISFILLLIGWMTLNVYAFIFKPVDPYPFILLNLILSCIAALQAPVIMMSQGRQAKKDRIAADLDYKINLKSELQTQQILVKLDKINASEMRKFNELKRMQKQMLKKELELETKLNEKNGKS